MGGARTPITLQEPRRAQVLNKARTTLRTKGIRGSDVCRVEALKSVIEPLLAPLCCGSMHTYLVPSWGFWGHLWLLLHVGALSVFVGDVICFIDTHPLSRKH